MDAQEHADKFRRGVELFNSKRFFDAHEAWEEVWLQSNEPGKTFLQGIIQVAAAFHHYQRGNTAGACSLLNAGLRRLEPFPRVYSDIEVDLLRKAAQLWAGLLSTGQDPGPGSIPEIHLPSA